MPSDGMKRLVVESEVLAVMLQLHAQLLAMADHHLRETRGYEFGSGTKEPKFRAGSTRQARHMH